MRINDLNELPAHMQEQVKKQIAKSEIRQIADNFQKEKRNKYGNEKTDGYDSKKEKRKHEELLMLEKKGLIKNLKTQVPFVLIPSQKDESGKIIERSVKYIADFVYEVDGITNILDVKSDPTRKNSTYIIKRKLMLYVHGIRIIEV